MEKIINKLIDEFTKGVDTYTHNGSTWLIFTDKKEWVVELTEEKTLWYNYNFFKGMFAYTSMDVVENQHYITKWVEDNVIGGVKRTMSETIPDSFLIEDTIQNGVKRTQDNPFSMITNVENTIQNGVKETIELMNELPNRVKKIIKKGVKETNHVDVMKFFDNKMDDAIENGVKETQFNDNENKSWVEGVIKKGIKETNHVDVMGFFNNKMEDTLQNGVRHTLNTEYMPKTMVEDIIENGVKETKTPGNGDIVSYVEWMKDKSNSYTKMIDDVIESGVKKTMLRQHITDGNVDTIIETGIKEVQPLPEQSGELIGYGNYYKFKEDRTKPFIDYLEETIKFGVKESLG